MREWLASLTRERALEIALALALGTVLASLAEKLAEVPVSVLAQHVGRLPFSERDILGFVDPFTLYALNFNVGRAAIAYGPTLVALLALGLLVLAAAAVVRQRDRALGLCPSCAALIPRDSRHCAYCGSSVTNPRSEGTSSA